MTLQSATDKAAKLEALNAFRAAEGKAPFAEWRQTRHADMLNAYCAAAAEPTNPYNESEDGESQGPNNEPGALMIDAKDEMVRESELRCEKIADVIQSNDFANKEVGEAFKGKKQPAYKVLMAQSGKTSLIDKPVGFSHQFLTEHPDLSRKEAVAALVKHGVNYATARTQYQRWFSKKG